MKLLGDASQVQTQFAGDTRMQFLSQPQEFDPAKASPMLQFQEQGSTHMSTLQLSSKALQHLESILVIKLDLRRQGH
jgi:hypothetical protein